MNLENAANLTDFDRAGFDQRDRTEAMQRRIVQRVAIEQIRIDKDSPVTIAIAEPDATIDVGSILRQAQIQLQLSLRRRHPRPLMMRKTSKTPDTGETQKPRQEFSNIQKQAWEVRLSGREPGERLGVEIRWPSGAAS